MLERMFDRTDAKSRSPRDCIRLADDWAVKVGTAAITPAKAAEPLPAPAWGAAICAWLRARVR